MFEAEAVSGRQPRSRHQVLQYNNRLMRLLHHKLHVSHSMESFVVNNTLYPQYCLLNMHHRLRPMR